jgi:glycosyltransferase involved in cell wall biosynthesis
MTMPEVLRCLPAQILGIDTIEVQVIDDGSTDRTAEVARENGVDHIVQLGSNRGLARAFACGIENALAQGADIVVNTDADNQYCAADIEKLVQPILENRADLVVGCRPIENHPEFGAVKKMLQKLGSAALRWISRTTVRDAASGFRAFSRETCQRLIIYSKFSYCMETLIQAGNMGLRVSSVDIRVNPKTRESRLFKTLPEYLYKTGSTLASMFVLYRPGRFFFLLGTAFVAGAFALGLRFVWLIYGGHSAGRTHLPSLILLAVLSITGMLLYALGILGEILKSQRRISEEILYLQRRSVDNNGQTNQEMSLKQGQERFS